MTQALWLSVIQGAFLLSTPVLLAALGGVLTARAGILNLGVEGIMLVGAFTGFSVAMTSSSAWVGLLAAMLAGAALGLLFALFSITLRANQIVAGLALTMFATGLSGYLGKPWIGVVSPAVFGVLRLPLLSDLPIMGEIFFRYNLLVYLSYLLVPFLWYFIFRSRPGLRLRSAGENPLAADTMGINVIRLRYLYTAVGSALAGAAGAYLSLAYTPGWIENMTAGRGWIAVALMIFSGYNPIGVLAGSLLFGAVSAIALRAQAAGTAISPFLLNMMPYILTVLALLVTTRRNRGKPGPAFLGVAYGREGH